MESTNYYKNYKIRSVALCRLAITSSKHGKALEPVERMLSMRFSSSGRRSGEVKGEFRKCSVHRETLEPAIRPYDMRCSS